MAVFSIGVVISLFNKEAAIGRTIGSVLNQSLPPDEVIVIDDGSTDRSAAIARSILARGPKGTRSRLVSQKNAGVSAARNRGAEESRSRYIAFLDGDDEWLPGYVAEVRKLAQAFPSATVLTVRTARQHEIGHLAPDPLGLAEDFFGIVENPLRVYRQGYGLLSSSSITLTREAWDRSGGFPIGVNKGEDMFWWLKLCMDETVAHSAEPLMIIHDEHSGIARRKGLLPYHLYYFLGTEEGRRRLEDPDLVRFFESNLVIQIGAHRWLGDPEVAAKLVRFARALPLPSRLKCWAVFVMPLWTIRLARWWRRRYRIATPTAGMDVRR